MDFSAVDPQKWINSFLEVAFKFVKVPLSWWNNLPPYVHWIIFGCIFLFACLMAWGIYKLRYEWQNRA